MNDPTAQPDDRTEVCITIDTEFSIAGHFENPERYKPLAEPVVYCGEKGNGHGLDYLLKLFSDYGVTATFFVECANYFYFGDQPMQDVVNQLKRYEQDIQLHVHPVWLSFDQSRQEGLFPRNDDCTNRSFEDLKAAIQACVTVFERWVGHQPLAVRTGSLRVDKNVYQVLRALQIPMSSNIALGVYEPVETDLNLHYGQHDIAGVQEYPVFTYQDLQLGSYRHLKSLQITSCSWPEMKYLLKLARSRGVKRVILLTHPFEYAKKSDFEYSKVTRNRVNQSRLESLCKFVQSHDQDFVFTSFTDMHRQDRSPESGEEMIRIPWYFSVHRKLQNKLNDLIWPY